MIITAIEPFQTKKVRIWLDGKKAFLLYKNEVRKLQLKEEQELSLEQYTYILNTVLKKRARSRALHLLENRERTERQLYDKLKQNEYPEEVIEDAIVYVKSYNYIDDGRYARLYIKSYYEKKSKRQLITELQRRGIDKDKIQDAFGELEDEYDLDNQDVVLIRKWIKKKLNREVITEKDYQKCFRFLLGKGFSYELIGKELAHCNRMLDR